MDIIICIIVLAANIGIFISDYMLYRKVQAQREEEAKDIDRFYIICPGCGKKINLSQTHVYMEDNDNGSRN